MTLLAVQAVHTYFLNQKHLTFKTVWLRPWWIGNGKQADIDGEKVGVEYSNKYVTLRHETKKMFISLLAIWRCYEMDQQLSQFKQNIQKRWRVLTKYTCFWLLTAMACPERSLKPLWWWPNIEFVEAYRSLQIGSDWIWLNQIGSDLVWLGDDLGISRSTWVFL